ncbi:hypothetical protein O3M35_005081 [Rhynocoris fuscipes]|uniref:Uncharacterized protein n=1 Tax=Rhynocoris fuscipes TaxID=488301 RepID=A0AAW1DM83_9HEMI
MGEEGSSSGSNAKVLLTQALLAASGFRGLPLAQKKGPKFAVPAFSISLLAGCVGFLEKLTGNETIAKLDKYTSSLCSTMVVPLVASEICLKHGVQLEMAAANIVYPTIHYIFKNFLENEDYVKDGYLEISHTISLAIMAYFSFQDSQKWGITMSLGYVLSSLAHKMTDDEQAKTLVLALANCIYALKVL